MGLLIEAYTYAIANTEEVIVALQQHLVLVAVPLLIGGGLGVSLGLWSARSVIVSTLFINSFNALRVIPSLAVLFLAIPYFGLSFESAAIALTLLVIPPVLISTDVAFRTIDPMVKEAAIGMGMDSRQILTFIEIPLALPVVISGFKTAIVEAIASATLAAFIGAGGMGTFIVLGFSLYDTAILLVGAVPVALMALIAEISLGSLQRLIRHP